jgi:translocation protein SEC72
VDLTPGIVGTQAHFKAGRYQDAISRYTMAASISVQRPAWESQQIMREELSAILSNRSAAQFEAGDLLGALVDADHVIQLRRNWSKGHFRKAKALMAMDRHKEARDAIDLGLAFEPNSTVRTRFPLRGTTT